MRSAEGLPPGAANYITAEGAARLREELARLRRNVGAEPKQTAELERVVASVTIVEAPEEPSTSVAFGARVTLRDAAGELQTYRIVGVNELELFADAVSWISQLGRSLLAAELNDRITLPNGELGRVIKIEYPGA